MAFFAGMAGMYARLYFAWRSALPFAKLGPGIKPRSLHVFLDDFDVEVAARIGRVFDAEGANSDPAVLDVAENVLKAGVAMFPTSPYLRIVYSNFLIEVRGLTAGMPGWQPLPRYSTEILGPIHALRPCSMACGWNWGLHLCGTHGLCSIRIGLLRPCSTYRLAPWHLPLHLPQVRKNNASGWAQLEMARKLEPNLSYQFSIFTREQEHKQKAAAGSSGEQVKLCLWAWSIMHVF